MFKWYVVDTRNGRFVKFTKRNEFSQETTDLGLASSFETQAEAKEMAKFCNDSVMPGAFRASSRRMVGDPNRDEKGNWIGTMQNENGWTP